jgi:hypothetical protein
MDKPSSASSDVVRLGGIVGTFEAFSGGAWGSAAGVAGATTSIEVGAIPIIVRLDGDDGGEYSLL